MSQKMFRDNLSRSAQTNVWGDIHPGLVWH
jgi:hypothetical protein